MKSREQLIKEIQKSFTNEKNFEPFIKYLRLYNFKLLNDGTRIDFNFPIKFIVGENGCNKTSILQALYGCPDGYSIGKYWFDTETDHIQNDRASIIYGYKNKYMNYDVETIKRRITRHYDNSSKINPDYWETARPLITLGMSKFNLEELQRKSKERRIDIKEINKSSTRWDAIRKNVVYIDCKEYLSAFDLYFYHMDFKKSKKVESLQEFIRQRSEKVNEAIKNNMDSYIFRNIQRIGYNKSLPPQVCRKVSQIMGEDYCEIKVLTHTFYQNISNGLKASPTIWIRKNDGLIYTEAFAGTGEARIINIVSKIMEAPKNSLILLDEPEISLHPNAIKELQTFILEQCLENKHQIVVTTHSPDLISGMPNKALCYLSKEKGGVVCHDNIPSERLFYDYSGYVENKINIFVEDKLDMRIVNKAIANDQLLKKKIHVGYIPGGAENIIKNEITSVSKGSNTFYILDGDKDKREKFFKKYKQEVTENLLELLPNGKVNDSKYLKDIISTLTGFDIKFNVSGNSGNVNSKELIEHQKEFINFWVKNVHFFSFDTPENQMMRIMTNANLVKEQGKKYYRDRTLKMLGEDIRITSEHILYVQTMDLETIKQKGDATGFFNSVLSIIKKIDSISKKENKHS